MTLNTHLKNIIKYDGYYDKLVVRNVNNKKYIDGWYNRTEKMLDVFFDGNYGEMSIDAVKGKVRQ